MSTRQQRTNLKARAWPTMDQLAALVQQKLEAGAPEHPPSAYLRLSLPELTGEARALGGAGVSDSLQRSSSFGGGRMPQDMAQALGGSGRLSRAGSKGSELGSSLLAEDGL
eukprot:SAG11_NODE_20654_length_441_cov_0.684211_1_plen_111_part_00